MSQNNLVFVYGTLKRGYGNYTRILKDATFVSEGVMEDPVRMKQVGFPAIFDAAFSEGDKTTGFAKGEVFEVSDDRTWKSLDNLESNGYMYNREERKVDLPDGAGHVVAWVYMAMPSFQAQIAKHPDITPNDEGYLIWS